MAKVNLLTLFRKTKKGLKSGISEVFNRRDGLRFLK